MGKKLRLDKFLGDMGFGSRKDLKEKIKGGMVSVDDKVIKNPGLRVDLTQEVVKFLGKEVHYREFVYVMLNKPMRCISATHDNRHKTVVDLLGDEYSNFDLFPVGRLDKDTVGLLILTNDGQLAHSLLSPKKHVDKKYYAKIFGVVTDEDVRRFKTGITLEDGYQTLAAQLTILSSDSEEDLSEIEVVIQEGKFHQVKRMFQAVDKEVAFLKRLSMGALNLDDNLEEGDYRELTSEELLALTDR